MKTKKKRIKSPLKDMTQKNNLKFKNMNTFRITYRMEAIIEANTKEEAQEIFDSADGFNELSPEYVEQISIEELDSEEEK